MRSVWERSLSQRERVAEGRVRGTRFANIVPLIRPFGPPTPVGRRTRPQIFPNLDSSAPDPAQSKTLLEDFSSHLDKL